MQKCKGSDGDQLNGTLSIDIATTEQLKALAPHKSVFDLNAPKMVSKNLSIPDTVVSTISSFIHHPDISVDQNKLNLMAPLFIQ